jgi:hypothetical protein
MTRRKRGGYDYPSMSGYINFFPSVNTDMVSINISGDPEGLRYMARLLNWMADFDLKEAVCFDGEREHIHLHPETQLGNHSCEVVVWRADAKGTGELPDYSKG